MYQALLQAQIRHPYGYFRTSILVYDPSLSRLFMDTGYLRAVEDGLGLNIALFRHFSRPEVALRMLETRGPHAPEGYLHTGANESGPLKMVEPVG
jgi:hypothetical protein